MRLVGAVSMPAYSRQEAGELPRQVARSVRRHGSRSSSNALKGDTAHTGRDENRRAHWDGT
jgi:hypothetical protein